jgi:hypothetical protein
MTKGSYKTPKAIVSPTVKDLYWIAGFLEGEGSFTNTGHSERVSANQVQREPLERLQKFLGGTISFYKYGAVTYNSTKDGLYMWFTSGARARGIMMTIYSLMSLRRKEQIKNLLIRIPT